MKKKKKGSEEITDDGEIFPVDTLGIPILVDVIETGAAVPDSGNKLEISAQVRETEYEPLDSDREYFTELPTDPQFDLITDKIVKRVTAEITVLLKPLVRTRVSLALQKYQDELVKPTNDREEIKPQEN